MDMKQQPKAVLGVAVCVVVLVTAGLYIYFIAYRKESILGRYE